MSINNNNDEFIYTATAIAVAVDLSSKIAAGIIRHCCDVDNRDELIEEIKDSIVPDEIISCIEEKGARFHE